LRVRGWKKAEIGAEVTVRGREKGRRFRFWDWGRESPGEERVNVDIACGGE
jgi:hypothetical protein